FVERSVIPVYLPGRSIVCVGQRRKMAQFMEKLGSGSIWVPSEEIIIGVSGGIEVQMLRIIAKDAPALDCVSHLEGVQAQGQRGISVHGFCYPLYVLVEL